MEDQNKSLMNDMEETRSSLTQKLEALENQVSEKIQPVTNAVERVTEATAGIVENVKETVHEVSEQIEETTVAISSAFNLRRQAERHPWVVFSVATTAGCMLGSFLGRRSQRHTKSSTHFPLSRSKHAKGSNGSSHHGESKSANGGAQNEPKSWFGEQLQHLKGVAVGTMMSFIRDLAKVAIPGALGSKIAEEVEGLTTRMGAEPLKGSVFKNEPEGPPAVTEPSPKAEEPTVPVVKGKSHPETVNRMRSKGSGAGL